MNFSIAYVIFAYCINLFLIRWWWRKLILKDNHLTSDDVVIQSFIWLFFSTIAFPLISLHIICWWFFGDRK